MNRIARGASTFSKAHDQFPDIVPKYYDDLNLKLDTISALGANLTSDNNFMNSLPYRIEEKLADRICKIMPWCDMVRYGLNGGDATEAAIRYARAYTKKKWVYSVGYHGSAGHWTDCTPPAKGCVNSKIGKFNDFHDLIQNGFSTLIIAEDVAAVIVEPVELDIDQSIKSQLKALRQLCTNLGIVLIFDEIITGLRFPKYCVSNYFGIYPDLVCMGKAWGNGYPLSFVAGKRAIMEDRDVFVSYTFAGFPPALKAALDLLDNRIDETTLEAFWNKAQLFMTRFNRIGKVKLNGYPTRATWIAENEIDVFKFWQEMYKHGILCGRAFFPKFDWSIYQYDMIIEAAEEIMPRLDEIELIGPEPVPTFRR